MSGKCEERAMAKGSKTQRLNVRLKKTKYHQRASTNRKDDHL